MKEGVRIALQEARDYAYTRLTRLEANIRDYEESLERDRALADKLRTEVAEFDEALAEDTVLA